jgi:hypothetical protein
MPGRKSCGSEVAADDDFDTGANLSITTYNLGDFIVPPKPVARPMRLGGFANGSKIEGIGIVTWTFRRKGWNGRTTSFGSNRKAYDVFSSYTDVQRKGNMWILLWR